MSRLSRMIRKLEEGCEFCGHCGKDITNQPDCKHRHTSSVTTSYSDDKFIHNKGVLIYIRPIRVTEVYLLYPDELTALPIFDPILISNYMTVNTLFRVNQAIDSKGHSQPVRYVRPESATQLTLGTVAGVAITRSSSS